jgi:hypothetical protein
MPLVFILDMVVTCDFSSLLLVYISLANSARVIVLLLVCFRTALVLARSILVAVFILTVTSLVTKLGVRSLTFLFL